MNLRLLDKYILKQVFIAGIACIIIFMIIWIMPEIFLKTVQRTINGVYTVSEAVSILLNEMPKVLNIALPVGMLLGSLLTFDRLSKGSELTVMRSCGLSFLRIAAPVLILSVFAAGFTFYTVSKLLPEAACRLKEIKREDRISQFVFPVKKPNGALDKIIIVPHFDNNNIKDAVVLNFYDEAKEGSSLLSSILMSDFVKYKNSSWTINEAKKYIISQEGIFNSIAAVKDEIILKGAAADNAYKIMRYSIYRDRELTNAQIKEYITLLNNEQMEDEYRFMLNNYIQRFTHSFMCILFAFLGCVLGFSKPREQKAAGMLIAAGVIFGYYITIPFFDMLAEKAVLPPYISASAPAFAVLILCAALKKIKDL